MILSNEAYDRVKWIALYLLPGLGTLWFTISSVWGLPYGEQILGTITAVDTFLAAIIGISKSNYSGEGVLVADPDNEQYVLRMDPNKLLDIAKQDSVTFGVENLSAKHMSEE